MYVEQPDLLQIGERILKNTFISGTPGFTGVNKLYIKYLLFN